MTSLGVHSLDTATVLRGRGGSRVELSGKLQVP